MEEGKKKKNPVIRILFILFIVYIAFYIAMENGYYENAINAKTTLTKEKMIEFEEDVKNGKDLDINKYIAIDSNNYENSVSKMGTSFSSTIDKIMNNAIKYTLKILESLFK